MNRNMKASNDSDEAPDLRASMEDSIKTDNGRVANKEPNGHHDPKQRSIYLMLLSFSVTCALFGFALLTIWMFKYRPGSTGIGLIEAGKLANLHVLMMYTFMVSLNMYSILVYRTHYSHAKERLKWTHAILSGGNIGMSLLGVYAMYKSHLMAGLANFYSLHSWIGALTNILYLSQFVFGFVSFMKPGLSPTRRAQMMPLHRFCGAAILVLAASASITGIGELVIFQDKDHLYSQFTAITFIANIAGISIVLMTALSIYLVTAPQYKRPSLAEEEPLRR